MPFVYPATEVYDASGAYRVVWSVEEWLKALSEGWLEKRPEKRGPGRPKKDE